MLTKYDEYRGALRLLLLFGELPLELTHLVAPHLSQEEIASIVQRARQGETVYFAAPPLRIDGAFQIITADAEYKSEKGNVRPAHLGYSYAGRTPESYAGGNSRGDVFHDYLHTDKALAYAREHWADRLVIDNWASYVTMILDDPKDLVGSDRKPSPMLYANRGTKAYPKTKMAFAFTTKRDWNQIINDHDKPQSEVIDDAIAEITHDPFVDNEIKGGRGGFTEFNCWRCGSGLGLTGCTSCQARFDDDEYRCGWSTPLSRKMVKYLTEVGGHCFETDPEEAMAGERQRWQQHASPELVEQYVAPQELAPYRDAYSGKVRTELRLASDDSDETIVSKLSQDSAAAAALLQSMLKDNGLLKLPTRRYFTTREAVHLLDSMGVYGDEIVALHDQVCGGDLQKMLAVLYANYLGQLTATAVHAMIEGRAHSIQVDALIKALDQYLNPPQKS